MNSSPMSLNRSTISDQDIDFVLDLPPQQIPLLQGLLAIAATGLAAQDSLDRITERLRKFGELSRQTEDIRRDFRHDRRHLVSQPQQVVSTALQLLS